MRFTLVRSGTGLAAETHALIRPNVPLHELMQEVGQLAVVIGAALAQFAGDVFGHVARPSLRCVEANHPDRIAVLAIQQIVNDTFEFGVFNVGLPPRATEPAEVIEYEIRISINARND